MLVRLEKDGATMPLEGEPFARGGEAAIWASPALPGQLAKVYLEPTPERGDKVAAMLANPPNDPTAKQGHTSIAWPTQRLLGEDGRCVGFVMPCVDRATSLFGVYNPKSRLQIWPLFHYGYLLRTARNLAISVRALHERGYVLGDLNESNVLVNVQTLVTVVDTDSFQVRAGERVFRCEVGKPEYIAPEIQGADFRQIDRLPEQDNFALAVLIFQLLMQGTHPFAGRYTGQGEPDVPARRIAQGHWPFAHKPRGPYEPNPTAPPFAVLPFPVRELMRQCFEDGHDRPASRPGPGDWHRALVEADNEMTDCVVNAQHHFHKSLDACPWCEMALKQGRDPFPSREQLKARAQSAVAATAAVVGAAPAAVVATATKAKASPVLLTAIPVGPGNKRKNPAAPAPTKPTAPPRPLRVPAPAKRLHPAVRLLLTPWPWLICLGAGGLGLLIWMIAQAAHKSDAASVAQTSGSKSGGSGSGGGAAPVNDDGPPGEVRPFRGHTKPITTIALSQDGERALSGGWDGTLRLWDVRTGNQLQQIKADPDMVLSVAISPDGTRALSGGFDDVMHLWNLDSGKEIRPFAGHAKPVRCVAFSPDGLYALSGGDDGALRYWGLEARGFITAFAGHTDAVTSVAFSPNGGRAVTGCADGLVRVWSLNPEQLQHELAGHDGPVRGVAFSPLGDRVVSGGEDGTIHIWNAETGDPIKAFPAHNGPVRCVAFTPDGRGILSSGDDGFIRLWDSGDWRDVYQYNPGSGPVSCIAFGGKNGRRAVCGGDDCVGRLLRFPDVKAAPGPAPGGGAPPPADIKPPELGSLVGTEWEGSDGPVAADVVFRFEPGGVLSYTFKGSTFTNGTWLQTGDSVYFEMNNKFRECQATIRGDQIDGDSWNVSGKKWKTSIRQIK